MRWLLDLIFPPRASELLLRHRSPEDLCALLAPTPYMVGTDRIMTLLPYQNPVVQAAIIEAKFHGNKHAQRLLGCVLQKYIHPSRYVVLPIPLSSTRKRMRGYNQVEEILKYARIPYRTDIVTRVRDTRRQTDLSGSERRTNMASAFIARMLNRDRIYLLVDDVTTTGATLIAARNALHAVGGQSELLALAH